jgi:hypothetical protein
MSGIPPVPAIPIHGLGDLDAIIAKLRTAGDLGAIATQLEQFSKFLPMLEEMFSTWTPAGPAPISGAARTPPATPATPPRPTGDDDA